MLPVCPEPRGITENNVKKLIHPSRVPLTCPNRHLLPTFPCSQRPTTAFSLAPPLRYLALGSWDSPKFNHHVMLCVVVQTIPCPVVHPPSNHDLFTTYAPRLTKLVEAEKNRKPVFTPLQHHNSPAGLKPSRSQT
jgi:hypothetical protein